MNDNPAGSLSLENLTRTFGDVTAVDNLSLNIQPGRITTLLGPSGCGKTTVLRMIAGFLEADRGQVLIDGRPQTGLPPFRRDTAMVFQDFALFPHMSVSHNVGYGLRHRPGHGTDTRRRVAEIMEFLQIENLASRMPHELSGGQQQRVALGRALAVRPRVLLMDEPLSNLDARLRVRVRSEFKAIQRELGVTTVFVTHDQEEALSLSDQIAVLNAGKVKQVGSPRELYSLPGSRFVAEVLGDANFLPVESVSEGPAGPVAAVFGQQLPVRAGAGSGTGQAALLVRPDWFTFLDAKAGSGLEIVATVRSTDYHGSHERCWLEVPGFDRLLQADVSADTAEVPEPGATVRLGLPAGKGVLVRG